MIIIAIVRMSRISNTNGAIVWQTLLQTLEGCVALLMASITAFRSIFVVSHGMRDPGQKRWAPPYSWIQCAKQRKTSKEGDAWENVHFFSMARATFARMNVYVRGRHGTAEGNTSLDCETGSSETEVESPLSVKSRRAEQEV